jgi:cell division transport system permease protein
VTLASVAVMIITLFVIGTTIFIQAVLDTTLEQIEEKVDVNVYFLTEASEPDVLALKEDLEELPEVTVVEYVSREDVLKDFRVRHESDELTLQALEELGENPFGAVLNVQADEASQYEQIAEFLASDAALASDGSEIVESVNYYRNKAVIDKLSQIINSTQQFSFIITIILVLISILITYNTLRLAIYTAREEISVMRLVGASNSYIRGPFVVEGVMYGLVAAIITLLVFYPLTFLLGDSLERFFVDFNLFDYYVNNFGEIFLIMVASGILIGAISSFWAVKRHLRV